MKNKSLKQLVMLGLLLLFSGFCIITDFNGAYRIYFPQDIPFIYRLHSSTPSNYFPVVWEAAMEWNKVDGSYFAFQEGPTTSNGNLGLNGENLVFFDLQGQNFAPGTNVIAFSLTWTSYTGGFHAIESDYIYNARDFPPGLNGEPGLQDLHQISVHELGHHLGLDHTGLPSGASSGCGPLVQQAVMWAFNAGGDTSKRRLHIEDIMGVIACYPNWVIQGHVKAIDNGQFIEGAKVQLNGTIGADIGPVINPIANRRNRVGLVKQFLMSDNSGNYKSVVKDKDFELEVDIFGFYPKTQQVAFNPPSGVGNTQFLTFDFDLIRTPLVQLSVGVTDSVNNYPVPFAYDIYWVERLDSALISSQTGSNGSFSETVSSAEYYRVVLKFNHPYVYQKVFDSLYVSESGLSVNFGTKPVNNLYVIDTENSNAQNSYLNVLNRSGYEFAIWNNTQNDSSLSMGYFQPFSYPLTLIWVTDKDSPDNLTAADRMLLQEHLRDGGRLVLSGRNISRNLVGDSLVTNYIGVEFNSNQVAFPVRGFDNDPIGNGLSFSAAITVKDRLDLSEHPIGNVYKSFYYGTGAADTVKIAGVRFESNTYNYRGFFMGFGLEVINSDIAAEIMERALDYTNDTGSTSSVGETQSMPLAYSLSQNYPNPFNPNTVITFSIPQKEKVELKVYNSIGEEAAVLVNKEMNAGVHKIEFTAGALASGVYFYRMRAGSFMETKKLLLLK